MKRTKLLSKTALLMAMILACTSCGNTPNDEDNSGSGSGDGKTVTLKVMSASTNPNGTANGQRSGKNY